MGTEEADRTTPEWAARYELDIATDAAAVRGDATELDAGLFLKLWPLLILPIPAAYIQTLGVVTGKPYESTGVRSVQVQMNRMDNVLTPLGWRDTVEYEDGGKLATVAVYVVGPGGDILLHRESKGGVDRGSTVGNLYKASYTNAAKRAFAMLGPGREVYVGVADLDPDVNADVAAQKGDSEKPSLVGKGIAKQLVDRIWEIEGAKANLRLAIQHVTDEDPGEVGTKAKATAAVAKLTAGEAQRLDEWAQKKNQADS